VAKKKDSVLLWIIIIICAIYFLNKGADKMYLFSIMGFPAWNYDSPSKTTEKNIHISYDNSNWRTITTPFTSSTVPWSATASDTTCYTAADKAKVYAQLPGFPADCIVSTQLETTTGSCYCYDYNCRGGYGSFSVTRSCTRNLADGWDVNQNTLYIKKTFNLVSGSKGAWIRVVPSKYVGSPNWWGGIFYNWGEAYNKMVTLGEGSDAGICYVNGVTISLSSQIYSKSRRNPSWGFDLVIPYQDISSYTYEGENIITCTIYKNDGALGNIDFELIIYGGSHCQQFHQMINGEHYPIDIPFQPYGGEDNLVNTYTKCNYDNFDILVKDSTQHLMPGYDFHMYTITSAYITGDEQNLEIGCYGSRELDAITCELPTLTLKNTDNYNANIEFDYIGDYTGPTLNVGGIYSTKKPFKGKIEITPTSDTQSDVYFKNSTDTIKWGTIGKTLTFSGSCPSWVTETNSHITGMALILTNISRQCIDTDMTDLYPDGKNIYEKGRLTDKYGDVSDYDFCSDSNTVYEWYCLSDGLAATKYIDCPNECIDGACVIKEILGDTDSDGDVEDNELIDFITKWMQGQYTNSELLIVITNWVNS
jgi:hypothetical protein